MDRSDSRGPAGGRSRPTRATVDTVGFADFGAVLVAARGGEEWAWGLLYDAVQPSIRGYLRAQGASEPEDLVGEVFVQMVRDFAGFEGGEREFRAWAFVIAHHRLLDDRRRRGRRPVTPASAGVIERHGPVGDAEIEALEALDAQRVRALIEGLARDQRNVLLLRIVGDLTVEEVARVVGKRPGAVKALQRRGFAALRQQLSQ